MAETSTSAQQQDDPHTIAGTWLSEIEAAQRYGKIAEWHNRGDKVIRRYKDERDNQRDGLTFRRQRLNMLWANVEMLKPALYARTPKPSVGRRNKDKNRVALYAGQVLERCLSFTLGYQDFDHVMKLVRDDYLLPGRGIAWEVYEPQIQGDKLEWETTRTKYIHWKDFLTNAARTWDEVWWAAHKAYQTRGEVRNLLISLGMEEGEARRISVNIKLDHNADQTPKAQGLSADDSNQKATIWCIWDKNKRQVVYVSPGWTEGPLAVMEPPIKLDNFFPCPRPLNATTASDSIIPIPDFAMYQDQADEIDELTQRIYLLTRALKVVGVYNGAIKEIGSLLNDATDNTMIPCDTWAMFAQQGGLEGAVDFFPIEMVIKTLAEAVKAREVCKQALYEITGISDIVRGATDPGETATAQQIKSQWGSLRVRDRQTEVQRFARDVVRIKAEVICETFSDDTIKQMSGLKLLTKAEKMIAQQRAQTDPQMAQQFAQANPEIVKLLGEPTWDEVLELLRGEHTRGFAIDIETDSTIEPDQMGEQQRAVEFLTAVGGYLANAAPIAQQQPGMMDLLGELLLFGVRRFKIGESIETTLEDGLQRVQQQMSQPKPDPEAQKAEMQAKVDQQKHQDTMALETRKHEDSMALERERMAGDRQIAREKMTNDNMLAQQKAEQDRVRGEQEMGFKERQMAAEGERHGADMALKREGQKAEMDMREVEVMRENGPLAQVIQALAQGQKTLLDGQDKMTGALEQVAQGLQQLTEAQMAEVELVRDPQTQRPIGARRKRNEART